MDDGTERWLPIPGWEDIYQVSDQGRVWGIPRERTRGGILKPIKVNKWGHLEVTLHGGPGVRERWLIHRLVMLAFVGPCPEGEEVRHLDGNPGNNTLANLAYGTHGQNNRDAVEHGTHFNASKTHCPRGHEYTPENTGIVQRPSRGTSYRYCKTCESARKRPKAA